SVTGFPLALAAGLAGRSRSPVPATATVPYVGATAIALALLAAGGGSAAGSQLVPAGFDPRKFPVAAVERARAAGLEGRVFHECTWCGSLLYAWPEQRVFIDGGTDFYGDELMRTSSEIKALPPGWQSRLAEWDVELVLMRPGAPLAEAL